VEISYRELMKPIWVGEKRKIKNETNPFRMGSPKISSKYPK
jgi:hypothetical protein